MSGVSSCRFLSLLLVLYLVTTAFFLLFIQHTSERHLLANHAPRSPLLVRRAQALNGDPPPLARRGSERERVEFKRRPADDERPRAGRAASSQGKHDEARASQKTVNETGKKSSKVQRPLILFWTPLWGRFDSWSRFFSVPRLGDCRARCSFTSQEDRLPEAALVLFSAADLPRTPPPLEGGRPERFPGQLWALFAPDPPPAEGRLQPHQVDGLFNWTVSYRQDADVPLQYGRVVPLARRDGRAAAATVRPPDGRRALFRPQQCATPSRREDYVRELSRHMPVDVLGPCGGGAPCGPAPQCLAAHAANHTFYLALEAAHCADFVSARLHQALRHGLIPVVRGGADYARLAPPDSFIDVGEFAGPEALARHLRSLSGAQVRRLHRWRVTHQVLSANWACDVCTRLHLLASKGERVPAHSGDRLADWWERGRCTGQSVTPPAA
ncbi:alpha-(1,3)-fucosyltransferase 7-like [Amphibalanus amphitrite]|uniref:alpha-(1,3)-fucosyltransferase 7-like n=1 Tax=Amphibalanus amphitrite TaxID=1232801 RepID=UPI001C9190D1|nr:alpha-(1,3)-fucosyltransferase 7-like [Amphibalanus amphitrite]